MVELISALVAGLLLLACLAPALARTRQVSPVFKCLNNLRRLAAANRQWTEDNNDWLLSYQTDSLSTTRPAWITGFVDFSSGNRSNWDPNNDIPKSPLWPYIAGNSGLFRCPADRTSVMVNGIRMPRVRSYSMSHVFGDGAWLDRVYNSSQKIWRTYSRFGEIMIPAKTFVFIEEHPDSINDGAFANTCTGAQAGDSPSAAWIIDYPASFHDGICDFSFADGHVGSGKWKGSKIRNAGVTYTGNLMLNVPAGDSWRDIQWLAANTTVRR